jgi:hypothetical protein
MVNIQFTPQITATSSETVTHSEKDRTSQKLMFQLTTPSEPQFLLKLNLAGERLDIAAAITGARPPASQRSVAIARLSDPILPRSSGVSSSASSSVQRQSVEESPSHGESGEDPPTATCTQGQGRWYRSPPFITGVK